MVIKAISELKKTHEEMGRVLDELEVYEDGVDADYSSVTIDYLYSRGKRQYSPSEYFNKRNFRLLES